MYIPPILHLTTEESLRVMRQVKLMLRRSLSYYLKNKKAWSF
ncbi:hypothetical protein [Hymenobacter metallicola]|nr:hypothetical protein [Hymenobacter metallicola]